MNEMELNCVLNVLQGGRPIETAVDWYGIFGFTQLHKIGGYFFRRLTESGASIPLSVKKQYLQLLYNQTKRNEAMGKYAAEIGNALEREKIDYVFLKGNVLSHTNFLSRRGVCGEVVPFYRKGERISNDIDLLVEPKEIGKVETILRSLGFIQGYYDDCNMSVRSLSRREVLERRMNRGETVPFQLQTDNAYLPHAEIDINFSLDHLPSGRNALLSRMLGNSILYAAENGGALRSLEEVDFLIQLLLHQYKEMRVYSMVMRGKDLELYKLLDIYLMMQRIDARALWKRALQYGVAVQAAATLKTVKSVFDDLELTDEIDHAVQSLDREAEYVIAPDTNKRFVWKAEVRERLKRPDHTGMLAEF